MDKLIIGILIGVVITWIVLSSNKRKNANVEKYSVNGVYNPPGQHMMILKESMDIMDKTVNPDTYFSRYKLASEKALYCRSEQQKVWNGLNCDQIYHILSDPDSKNELQTTFITRLFDRGMEDRLTFQMHKVGRYLTDDALTYFVEMLAGKKYHFCRVSFGDQKLYTYVSKDRTIKKGDIVTVPSGNGSDNSTKAKQVIETFDAPLDDLDFPLTGLRCVEDKISIEDIGDK